jgi:hypothetical protein
MFQLKVPDELAKAIALEASNLTLSLTDKILTQFNLLNVTMETDDEKSKFFVRICLQRLPSYHLVSML